MGSSSKQVTGYRYFANFLLFIGNPIEKVLGINFDKRGWETGKRVPMGTNGELCYLHLPNLYGENEGGVSGVLNIKYGSKLQTADSAYAKYMSSISLPASAYRYQSYISFSGNELASQFNDMTDEELQDLADEYEDGIVPGKGFYLGNSGYMKEMLLWPKRTRIRNDGRRQWYEVRDDGAVVCEIGAYIAKESLALSNSDETGPLDFKVSQNRDGAKSEYYFNYSGRGAVSDLLCDVGTTSFGGGEESDPSSHSYTDFITSNPNLVGARLLITIEFQNYSESFALDTFIKGAYVLASKRTNYGRTGFGYDQEVIIQKYDVVVRVPENPLDIFEVGAQTSVTGNRLRVDGENYVFGSAVRILITRAEGKGFSIPDAQAPDINPIHKIREILTDDTAMGKPESDINDENFIKAADRIFDEGLGISWAIDEKSCLEAIEELCGHIEAGVRVNRQTGLYEMVLFRDDWFEESEIHTIAVNKIKSMSLEVANADEAINQLNVSYYNRDAIKDSSFSIAENASIRNLNGRVNAEDADFPYFMNQRNAAVVAQWKLKQMSSPVWKGSFTTAEYNARKWNRYDLLKLAWPRKWQGTITVRIMKINLGTGTDVAIDFVEIVPYSSNLSSDIVIDEPIDIAPQPPLACQYEPFEMPYYLAVMALGQRQVDEELSYENNFGLVAVVAEKPQSNSLYAVMMTHSGIEGEEWVRAATINYEPVADLDQNISKTSTSFTVKDSTAIAELPIGTLIKCGSDWIGTPGEWMVFDGVDPYTGVVSVKRGALDTLPQDWGINTKLYFCGNDVAFDSTEYVAGEEVLVSALTTTPSGMLENKGSIGVEMNARAFRPYPPANVKINDQYWPAEIETDLILTWVDRNRVQQTGGEILSWFDGGVTIEPNTQTHLTLTQYDENQIELATNSANVSGTNVFTFQISSMQAETRTVEIVLKTIRDGYECYQPFVHTVELSMFFSEPYNFTAEFRND